jgi:peptidylprolyl isomerase
MRRTLSFIIAATLLGAACAESDPSDSTADSVASDTAAPAEPADTDTTGSEPDTSEVTAGSDPAAADAEVPTPSPDKPTDIDFPGEAPAELVTTVLSEGDGEISEVGDLVLVDYIGVRSLDGVEFDNSYDTGRPFAVAPVGSAGVIPGWNAGLVGVQEGARIQLDIPAEQAYGEAARSEVIRENEPLTFVIDVRDVVKSPDPSGAPTETGVEPSEGATDLSFEDTVEGDGDVLEEGQTAVFHLVLFRADNGAQLDSTWAGSPIQIPMDPSGFPALVQGMPGMKVGGRRAITAPPAFAFGDEGSPEIGLPVDTDVVIVIDLFLAF